MKAALHRTMTRLEWGMLILLSLLWGGSFFFTEVALREWPPLTLVVLRVGLAALVLHGVVLALGQRMPGDWRAGRAFLVMGLLNNAIPFALIVWGQTRIAGGLASILNATTPLFGVIAAHLLTADERMSGGRLAGVLVGFAGVVVMIGPAAAGGLGADVAAQAAVLSGALSYALAGVYGRRFRAMGVTPLVTAAGQVTASTAILLPLALLMEQPWSLPPPSTAVGAAVLGLALLSTVLAYILYFRILATAGATNILLVTFLIPVSAIVLGSLVLGERLDPRHFAGMALIGCGLAAIDGRLLRAVRTGTASHG
jgi:drug/metabolite transporter (DMT)-like permease